MCRILTELPAKKQEQRVRQIPISKHQIPNKLQIQNINFQNVCTFVLGA
jgi:hypothetical protein